MISKSNNLLYETPLGIYNYLNKYYVGALLSEITYEIDEDYNVFHNVSVSLEDAVCHLKFDADGTMVHRTIESLIEMYDEEFFDYD